MQKYLIIGNAQSVHVVKWVKELVKYFEVFVVSSTTTHQDILEIVPLEHILDLRLPVKGDGGNISLLNKFFIVKRFIKKVKPDFINPHYITSHGFLIALIKITTNLKFKLIQSAWGTDILVTPFKSKLYYQITRFCLNAADLATSDSEYMTKVINDISGVKTSTFIFGLDKLPDVRPEDKNSNLYFSNRMLSENYNIEEVIRLFRKIFIKNDKSRLIISHDGNKRQELEQLSKELQLEGKITFKGFVSLEEQLAYYKEARFYISIPTSDSTSVSLIEAMAYGCIPIVSDIPANREWIVDGENGIYYHDQLSFTLLKDIQKKKDQIFKKNREIIEEKAIFPKSIKEYVNLIQRF
jgi:glycosyltransferase involved in cell wall biosynthesis